MLGNGGEVIVKNEPAEEDRGSCREDTWPERTASSPWGFGEPADDEQITRRKVQRADISKTTDQNSPKVLDKKHARKTIWAETNGEDNVSD